MITDYFMITEESNRLQVIMITDYNYPISDQNQAEDKVSFSRIQHSASGEAWICDPPQHYCLVGF